MNNYLQLVYTLRQDLDRYTFDDIQTLGKYHHCKSNIVDLKWMIALKNANKELRRSSRDKASMPPAVEEYTINTIPTKMIFISGNYVGSTSEAQERPPKGLPTSAEIQLVEQLIKNHSNFVINSKDYLYGHDDTSTEKDQYKAYMLIDGEIAAVSSGKYMVNTFDPPVTIFGFMNESEIKWVQTSNKFRGKGLCTPFVQFILSNLKNLGADHVVVDNVGGVAGCKCYVKAAKALGMGTVYVDSSSPDMEYWQEVDCSTPENITHLFFGTSEMYQEYLVKFAR
uniref:Uncharacterized protein n=1 Tax=Marseillevirus LCMAC201 TaxID=2506605 RepID=A0A481YVL2_9VIRU|nr:MAG: hypothetical protein LCMAC201_02430 [Marseillevirus LCMAC201]